MHPLLPPLPASGSSQNLYKRYGIPSPSETSEIVDAHGPFHPVDTGAVVVRTTLIFGGVGLAVSAIQNALDSGFSGMFNRTGGTIGYFTALGFAFSSASAISANVRETDDAINNAIGGCAAGFASGIKAGSFPFAVGGCAFMGALMGAFHAAGNSLGSSSGTTITQEIRDDRRKSWFKRDPKFTQLAEQGQVA